VTPKDTTVAPESATTEDILAPDGATDTSLESDTDLDPDLESDLDLDLDTDPEAAEAEEHSGPPTFADLGVREETVTALAAIGIITTFAIQEYALPIALRGADMIGQAPTGTGKTLGFGVPLLQRVLAPSEGADGLPQALVVLPTRELCLQVARDIAAAGSTRGVRVLSIYGGVAYETQTEALTRGVEIVVGTPGRLLDLTKGRQLRLDRVRALVLDEADRMLDLGFLYDVEKILAMLPVDRQTMLFSATMPDPIAALARRFLRQPITVRAHHDLEASPLTRQVVYRTHPLNKIEVLARILQAEGRGLTMIFTRTKRSADRVAEDLDFRGFAAAAVHGDLGQGARERALRAFRSGKVDALVATDVAARGLDVFGVTHVINYDCPEDAEAYVHRTGRTGRAGAKGVAVTFVDWEDMPRWRLIEKTLGLDLTGPSGEPPETYHTSAHVYSDLDIPAGATGTLPSAERTRVGLAAEQLEDIEGKRGRRRGNGKSGAPRRPAAVPAAPAWPGGTEAQPAATATGRGQPRRRRRRQPDRASTRQRTATAAPRRPAPRPGPPAVPAVVRRGSGAATMPCRHQGRACELTADQTIDRAGWLPPGRRASAATVRRQRHGPAGAGPRRRRAVGAWHADRLRRVRRRRRRRSPAPARPRDRELTAWRCPGRSGACHSPTRRGSRRPCSPARSRAPASRLGADPMAMRGWSGARTARCRPRRGPRPAARPGPPGPRRRLRPPSRQRPFGGTGAAAPGDRQGGAAAPGGHR
jgi:superfamily II DNA/RNA helicase